MIPLGNDFDKLLGGGLQPGVITHVYGPPASGKTNLALMATARASREGRVLFVDSEGGFSVERLRQITRNDLSVLDSLLLIEPTSFDEQKVAVSKLAEIVPQEQVSLIIVDSISMLYRLEEEKDIRDLGRMLAKLLHLARKYHLPVLATNQVYTDIDSGKITSVGGRIHEYWSKIMIETGVNEYNGSKYALLKKHLFLPEGIRLDYRIVDEGIEPLKLHEPAGLASMFREDLV